MTRVLTENVNMQSHMASRHKFNPVSQSSQFLAASVAGGVAVGVGGKWALSV